MNTKHTNIAWDYGRFFSNQNSLLRSSSLLLYDRYWSPSMAL